MSKFKLQLFLLFLFYLNQSVNSNSPKIMEFHFNPIKVEEGKKAFASCFADSGEKPFQVKWIRDGKTLSQQAGHISITNINLISVLEFISTSINDQGNYTCEVSNRFGIDSYTAELIVTAPPKLISYSKDEMVAVGQTTKLKCLATGNPKPAIIWFHSKNHEGNFQRLFENENIKLENDSSIVVINKSTKANEGIYRCEASNKLGTSITREIKLLVEVPPIFTYTQGNVSIGMGSSLELRCEAESDQKPKIVWNKINAIDQTMEFGVSSIYPDGSQRTTLAKKYIGSGTKITLSNIKLTDAGFYECQAENVIKGLSSSQTFKVDVKLPPSIEQKEITIEARRDETVRLKCNVAGTMPMQVNWFKQQPNGLFMSIVDNNNFELAKIASNIERNTSNFGNSDTSHSNENSILDSTRINLMNRDFISFNRTVFELHIASSRQKDSGIYLCKVFNNYGEDTSKIRLVLKDVPEAPERLEIDQTWSRSAALRWTLPPQNLNLNAPIKHFLLQYWRDLTVSQQLQNQISSSFNSNKLPNATENSSTEANYGSVYRLYEIEIPANQNQYILKTNLLPGTAYRLRLYSMNEFGKSHFSANARLITEQEEPGKPPTDIRLHGKTTSTIKLSWRAPPRTDWNGPLTSYLIAYKLLRENEIQTVYDSKIISTLEQTFAFNTVRFTGQQVDDYYQEYVLSGLQKASFYCVIIKALNKVGQGPYSHPIVVSTSNNDPPEAPLPYIDTIQKNSMVIKWTQNGNKEDITHYVLYYKDEKSVWLEITFPAKNINSYVLTNLNEGTVYEIYMKASSHFGMSEPSKVIRQMTQIPAKDNLTSMRSLQETASKIFGVNGANIPPYLRSHVVIPISIALVLIVIICSVAVGYIKYEEKKTALIQASLGLMASSPSKNFHYLSSTTAAHASNANANNHLNTLILNSSSSNSQTSSNYNLNGSTVSEEAYLSLRFTDQDKSNKPLLAARPTCSNSLWAQQQGPILEESESCSLADDSFPSPYATLPYKQIDSFDFSNNEIKTSFNQLPPPLPANRPPSINLVTSAMNIANHLD